MSDRNLSLLSDEDLDLLHRSTMDVLGQSGIGFPYEPALEVFRRHEFRIEDEIVYFEEGKLMELLQQAPSSFTLHARNPERSVEIGKGQPALAPGYGAPFLSDAEQGVRKATVADYHDLVRVAHMLPNQDLSGHLIVQPDDVPPDLAHLRMLEAHLLLSDKPFFGSTEGETGAQHTVELTALAFGVDPGELQQNPAFIGLINTLSPLHFSREMLAALMVYARHRQPVLVAAAAMAGSTAPVTLAGTLVQQNAEVLAGIALAQLISPGTPVVYGSTSTNMDMRTGAMAIGSPELSMLVTATAQMARYYGFPSRSGGALSDSHTTDARAGYESAFSLLTAVESGIDLILHAAGILSSYLVFSREKFVLDDDLCGMARHLRGGLPVTQETLALDSIHRVHEEGNYLKDPQTLERCRTEFWDPATYRRDSVQDWLALDRPDAMQLGGERWQELLSAYEEPEIDASLHQRISAYIEEQMNV
jgi:trimethylamine--corrinoid protein Co-methyltransferase